MMKDDVEVEYALHSKTQGVRHATCSPKRERGNLPVIQFTIAYPENIPRLRGGLHSKLPGELKGKLPTAKQLAAIVIEEMGDER